MPGTVRQSVFKPRLSGPSLALSARICYVPLRRFGVIDRHEERDKINPVRFSVSFNRQLQKDVNQ